MSTPDAYRAESVNDAPFSWRAILEIVQALALAVIISVGYWVVHSMALAFAKADLLPPILAAWTANIVFAGIGTVLLFKART